MVKLIRKVGNGTALPLDRTICEQMGIEVGSEVQLTMKGKTLVVEPVEVGIGTDEVNRRMESIRERYGDVLRELAK